MHDQCYTDAMQHPECWPIFDNPYTEFYYYSCDKQNKKVTCGSEYTETEGFSAHLILWTYAVICTFFPFSITILLVIASGKCSSGEMRLKIEFTDFSE